MKSDQRFAVFHAAPLLAIAPGQTMAETPTSPKRQPPRGSRQFLSARAMIGRRITSSFALPTCTLAFVAVLGLCVLFSVLQPRSAIAGRCGDEAQTKACDLPTYGGPGGGRFRTTCPPGYFLQSLGARAGSYVDAVQAICRQWNGETTGNVSMMGWFGGNGGGNATASCPNDSYVKALRVNGAVDDSKLSFVRGFRVTCTDVVRVQCGGYGGDKCKGVPGDSYDFNECPKGMLAVGLWGKHGIYVDSLGLICGPEPTLAGARDPDALSGFKKSVDDNAAASEAARRKQREFEIQVTGKSAAQCQASNQQCEARAIGLGPAAATGYIASECMPYFVQCMNNAAADAKAYADQRAFEIQVTGKTVAQCQASNLQCEARGHSYGPAGAPGYIASECTPYFVQCMNNAQAALATEQAGAAPAPAETPVPGGGGVQTASTCGLPGGTATVTIADPAITTLNVRDKPQGKIIARIPEGSQVEVLGGCGVEIAAGIVAQKGGGKPPAPGWCAIAEPIGCVSEKFLVAGVPDGGAVDLDGAAGILATKPQATEGPTFTGTWSAEAQGLPYTMSLDQSGNTVTGNYTGGDGSVGEIEGKVSGGVLRFAWRQTDGTSGMGRFKLSSRGNSFTGSYTLGNNPDVAEGAWNGRRQ